VKVLGNNRGGYELNSIRGLKEEPIIQSMGKNITMATSIIRAY
jgi:hypothetical protein